MNLPSARGTFPLSIRRRVVGVAYLSTPGAVFSGMGIAMWVRAARSNHASNPDFMLGLSGGIVIGLALAGGVAILVAAALFAASEFRSTRT